MGIYIYVSLAVTVRVYIIYEKNISILFHSQTIRGTGIYVGCNPRCPSNRKGLGFRVPPPFLRWNGLPPKHHPLVLGNGIRIPKGVEVTI